MARVILVAPQLRATLPRLAALVLGLAIAALSASAGAHRGHHAFAASSVRANPASSHADREGLDPADAHASTAIVAHGARIAPVAATEISPGCPGQDGPGCCREQWGLSGVEPPHALVIDAGAVHPRSTGGRRERAVRDAAMTRKRRRGGANRSRAPPR
jgi:hypothetical protein